MKVKTITAFATATAFALGGSPAVAHPHKAGPAHHGAGQVIANGQLHGAFVSGVSCDGDPAAYGLETAHHGPDAGTAGNADGCYRTTGAVAPGSDVQSPAIR